MVELADTPDLGSGAVRYVGSSPILGIAFYAQVVELADTLDSGSSAVIGM